MVKTRLRFDSGRRTQTNQPKGADMPEQTWSHGEYMLWLNNTEGSHFDSHRIVARMLDDSDEQIGRAVLDAWPPRDFSDSIDPDQVDATEVGRELRDDHADLGY